MKIIGFNKTRISAQRKERHEGQLAIDQKINIKDLSKEKIPINDSEAIKIEFTFTTTYSKDFAKIEFEGNVIILPEGKETEEFTKSWKSKKIPEDLRLPIFNFIMGKCSLKALTLEEELNLPLHIQMPRLKTKKDE